MDTTQKTALSPTTWVLAARPKTLPASLVPVIVGICMAFQTSPINPLPCLAIMLAALLIQIATNFANDVIDFEKGTDREDRLGPMRVTQAGLVTARQMKWATASVISFALLIGSYLVTLGGIPILIIGLLSLSCTLLYTAGPFSLSYTGLADVFVLVFFGPVAVGGTFYILTNDITAEVLIAGLAIGLISTAILVVNNLRDVDSDIKTGKRTLAVRFGRRFAKTEYALAIATAGLLPLLMYALFDVPLATVVALLYLLPAIPVTRSVLCSSDGPTLNRALENTGKLLVLYGVLFSAGWLIGY